MPIGWANVAQTYKSNIWNNIYPKSAYNINRPSRCYN